MNESVKILFVNFHRPYLEKGGKRARGFNNILYFGYKIVAKSYNL